MCDDLHFLNTVINDLCSCLHSANGFQANLLKTMMQIESVYVELAALEPEKNVLIVYDRGTMDPSACTCVCVCVCVCVCTYVCV